MNGHSVDQKRAYLGIDLGTHNCIVCSSSGQILRNEIGGITTSTLVGFVEGRERHIGESAVGQLSANAKNTISRIVRFLGRSYDVIKQQDDYMRQYDLFEMGKAEDGRPLIHALGHSYQPVETLAMLIGQLRSYQLVEGEEADTLSITLAVPAVLGEELAQEVFDAARIAGLSEGDIAVVSSTDALLAAYRHKQPQSLFVNPTETRVVLIVDAGHSQTNIILATCSATGFPHVLAQKADACLGAANFDDRLFQHFANEIEGRYGGEGKVAPASRKGFRLMAACQKVRTLLSTLPKAQVQVENVVEGRDVDLQMGRETFASLVQPEVDRFRRLVEACLREGGRQGTEPLSALEITGGAMRMPILQAEVVNVTRWERPLGLKLDDAAVAFGASLLGKGVFEEGGPGNIAEGAAEVQSGGEGAAQEEGGESMDVDRPAGPRVRRGGGSRGPEEIGRLAEEERQRRERDAACRALAEVRNSLESFVLELRGLGTGKYGHLVDVQKAKEVADDLENWLYSDEGDAAGLEETTAKLDSARHQARQTSTAYYEAVEKDKAEYEAALEAESKREREEREANGEDDDHDNRRLKVGDRMKLALKNKDEGNELFADGNYRPAGARYTKALTHCAKFFDLSPEEEVEVKKLKVSLYSNLALCYTKLEQWDHVLRTCDEGLKLDETQVKLYYRRAFVRERRGLYDEAEQDLLRATKVAPEDKNVATLLKRVRAGLKKQSEREKAMWGKAFASN